MPPTVMNTLPPTTYPLPAPIPATETGDEHRWLSASEDIGHPIADSRQKQGTLRGCPDEEL